MTTALRVAINAQFVSNSGAGGIESVVVGLVRAIGQLDGPEEYVLISDVREPEFLRSHLGPNQRVVVAPAPRRSGVGSRVARRLVRSQPWLDRAWSRLMAGRTSDRALWPTLSASEGFLEALNCQVAHFPYQCYVMSSIPSVYNPHDLQHLHLPGLFSSSDFAQRETVYRAACRHARRVVVASDWVKDDLVTNFGVSAAKVVAIPWAPPTAAYARPTAEAVRLVAGKHALPGDFAFYPAMLWEHKNHLRLLDALALLRDRDRICVPLVCTGSLATNHWPRVEVRVRELRLEGQVRFLGLVPPGELRAIYRLARFVIVPTLYEAASGPVLEAWQDDLPAACSTVTSLPEQVGDAALLFDPLDVEAIAGVMRGLASDGNLRAGLIERGRRRVAAFTWERTARAYRDIYRAVARETREDRNRAILGR